MVAINAPSSSRRPSVPPATRTTRHFPQKRARDTYESLLAASSVVFADKGFDAAQAQDIAGEAGVSVGTFYRYFADKRQAFIEMITAHLEDAWERLMVNLTPEQFGDTRTPAERRAAVDHVIEVLFANMQERPNLHRVFLGMSLRDVDVAKLRTDFDARGREALAALLGAVVSSERIRDYHAAAHVLQVAAAEVAIATTGGGPGPALPPERADAMRSELADMFYRYLFAPLPPPPRDPQG